MLPKVKVNVENIKGLHIELDTSGITIPCDTCLARAPCMLRIKKEYNEYDSFKEEYEVHVTLTKRNVVTGFMMTQCSIIKEMIEKTITFEDPSYEMLPKGGPATFEMIIKNDNVISAIYEYLIKEFE